MPNNFQFLDDPDDVPFIESGATRDITIHVEVDGDDEANSGVDGSPFRSLGKAIDVLRNKIISKTNMVTVQLGAIKSSSDGGYKKYFEEDDVKIDFESAKRVKIKGVKPTDHEVIAINYYDKAPDREGYYCQIVVSNQDKISVGDYLGIYDHLKIKKANPSYFWARNNIKSPLSRTITTNNCYVEAIRCDMILGCHEVVDVGPFMTHSGNYSSLDTELFQSTDVKIGVVTLHVKNENHTYKNLSMVPYWTSLGRKKGDAIYTYAAGPGNSPIESKQSNSMPPVFYGGTMLSNPQTLESQGLDQFYFDNPIQQVEIVDIMIRGYRLSINSLDDKIIDPRNGKKAKSAILLWNDKTLTGYNRIVVSSTICSYFYKKLIQDLGINLDLPFYFGESSDPFIPTRKFVQAAKKVRDYLLAGAENLEGVPSWDEDNHPGFGYGPFEGSAVRRPPFSGGADVDTTSYPSEYRDETKLSYLLQTYNIYPPINGQLYKPTLIRRIRSWYNDNATEKGLQLDRWEKVGNQSPFFCGYITPQGWYKQRYFTNTGATTGAPVPSLSDINDNDGYHKLIGSTYPQYVANPVTIFNKIAGGARGAFSNERSATKNSYFLDPTTFYYENSGISGGGFSFGNTSDYSPREGSMGSVWYSGLVNFLKVGDGNRGLGAMGLTVFDRYSFAYEQGSNITANDNIISKTFDPNVLDTNPIETMYSLETTNIRAKCFKTILRFGNNGIKISKKSKLGLLKDVCIVNFGRTNSQTRNYGLLADEESVINATNIAVCSFSCGISSKNQSLINLLADLGNSDNQYHKDMFRAIDPAAFVTANGIGMESTIKSHINAQRTISSGSKMANYLAIASSSMDCSNSVSVGSQKHGFVCEFNSYMKATNSFSEFNSGIGFCAANNSLLVCHRSRSIWNGYHGLMATNRSTIKCYEFIARSNDGDGILAQNKSTISAGANSTKCANYRKELISSGFAAYNTDKTVDNFGTYSQLPPHLYQIKISAPLVDPSISLPDAAIGINSNPTHSTNVLYHESNSTISEFNSGSGFASEADSLIVADNTISRYNSKKYGEFYLYGWSGIKGSFPTDTFAPSERSRA